MNWLKRKIQNYLLRKLFNPVILGDIISVDSKTHTVFLNGVKLDDQQRRQLNEEVNTLKKSWVWQIYQNTIRHQAHKVMFDKSVNYDDMISGKLMLYNLDVLKNIIDKLST